MIRILGGKIGEIYLDVEYFCSFTGISTSNYEISVIIRNSCLLLYENRKGDKFCICVINREHNYEKRVYICLIPLKYIEDEDIDKIYDYFLSIKKDME